MRATLAATDRDGGRPDTARLGVAIPSSGRPRRSILRRRMPLVRSHATLTTSLHGERVALTHDAGLAYPLTPPFDRPNPVYDAVFRLLARLGLDAEHAGRPEWNPLGALERRPLPGDPRGYRTVDLGAASSFAGLDGRCDGLRFHHSNPGLPSLHHRDGRHEYSFGKTVLAADLLISMPKMKSHKKTGVTLGLKNMIGTTNQKYWLPHFTAGAPPAGGDYPGPPPLGWRRQTFPSRRTLPGGHAAVVRFPRPI